MINNKDNSSISIFRIFIKTVVLLAIINFSWILISRLPIGKISIYNIIVEGRQRFPFGQNPSKSYNLSLYDLKAMFASHKIAANSKDDLDEKIILIGDSSIWGFLHEPHQTLTGLLNNEFSEREESIAFYNLGYPSISILKDLMIIEKSMEYKPTLIIWFTTLEALPKNTQLDIPLVKNNPHIVNQIIEKYDLKDVSRINESHLENTFWKERRNISDIFDLQIYGLLWSATGIDQEYPDTYQFAQRDFEEPIDAFHGILPEHGLSDNLSLEIISNGIENNPDIGFIVINEPILISEGINSSQQYNFYYPKWAYDNYRIIMNDFAKNNKISYYDLWNIVPQSEFTNSAIHLSKTGEEILFEEIVDIIENYLEIKGVND